MVRVRLTTENPDQVCLQSPYSAELVDRIKSAIPYSGRAWDSSRKVWLVSMLFVPDLMQLLADLRAQVMDDRIQVLPQVLELPPMPDDLREAFDTLHLAYTAPLGAAEAVYRFWAKQTHTDVGGNPEQFRAASEAITVIRRYLDPKEAA